MELYGYEIDENRLPAHVAIIMDGNGRWAKKRMRPRIFGHNAGMKTLHKTVKLASDMGIKILTVYAFSTENWKRSVEEVSGLMNLAVEYFIKELAELDANGVQFRVIGDMAGLPEDVRRASQNAIDKTRHNHGLILNVALNYGGRDDIVHAVRSLVDEGVPASEITEEAIGSRLYTGDEPDPDLMIRTGGEERLSNFLLWQNAYAEFMFDDILWPDFDEEVFCRMIYAFQNRDRRYGSVK